MNWLWRIGWKWRLCLAFWPQEGTGSCRHQGSVLWGVVFSGQEDASPGGPVDMAGCCVSHRIVRAHRSLLLRMSCLPRLLSVLCATLFVNAASIHASGPRASVQSSFSFIGLANSPLGFFHNILWKNANEFFGQLNSFYFLSIWASVSQRASHLILLSDCRLVSSSRRWAPVLLTAPDFCLGCAWNSA